MGRVGPWAAPGLAPGVTAILERNMQHGMSGCPHSLDCTHWKWTRCPQGKRDQYQSRGKTNFIDIEAVCDKDIWIWHGSVGAPGSENNLNVLGKSRHFNIIQARTWPSQHHPYIVNGRTRTMPYYGADGIYPQYAFLATPFPESDRRTREQISCIRLQQVLRKNLKRLFVVVTSRFRIARHPSRYCSSEQLNTASRAAAIVHVMVVEQRRAQLAGRRLAAAAAAHARRVAYKPAGMGAVDARRARLRDRRPSRRAESTVADAGADAGAVEALCARANSDTVNAQGPRPPGGRLDPLLLSGPEPAVMEHASLHSEGSVFASLVLSVRTSAVLYVTHRDELMADIWTERADLLLPYLRVTSCHSQVR